MSDGGSVSSGQNGKSNAGTMTSRAGGSETATEPPVQFTQSATVILPNTTSSVVQGASAAPLQQGASSTSGDSSGAGASATSGCGCSAKVLSLFECPVCFGYMLPPYLQCKKGHLVCGDCRPKLEFCPTCRGRPPSVRNLVLEKIADDVVFPCKYSSNGCPSTMLHTEKVEHEKACEFRPYVCPHGGNSCKWKGSLEAVMPHLTNVHKSIIIHQGETINLLLEEINLPEATDWVIVQSCFGFHFIVVLEKKEKRGGQQMFYGVVQLMGSWKQSDSFMYRLELSAHGRSLSYKAKPPSIREGVDQAITQLDCFAIDTSAMQGFVENGNLRIEVTITMV